MQMLLSAYMHMAELNSTGALQLDNIVFTGRCAFPALTVLINEVAWAGTGIPGSAHPNDEWIRVLQSCVPYSMVELTDDDDINIAFDNSDIIRAGEYFLLGSSNDIFANPAITINQPLTGTLTNGGETLSLFDLNNFRVDTANLVTTWYLACRD